MACDQEPVSGPSNLDKDDEQQLFDVVRGVYTDNGSAQHGPGDGDIALSRPAAGNGGGGGGDIILFDIVGVTARNSAGSPIQTLSDTSIASPGGQLLCTKTTQGGFSQLRDSDGDVILSSVGPFVFDGQPQLAGKNPAQQFMELATNLRYTFALNWVVEGHANTGVLLVKADAAVQLSSNWRKLVIASLVDGYCGSDGLD